MLTALILICSVAVSPDLGECTRKNATTEMRLPSEFENPILCLMHAQAYLARASRISPRFISSGARCPLAADFG